MKTNAALVKELSIAISGHFDVNEYKAAHKLKVNLYDMLHERRKITPQVASALGYKPVGKDEHGNRLWEKVTTK